MERATIFPSINQNYLLCPSRAFSTRLHSFPSTRNSSSSSSSIKFQPSSSVSSSVINGGISPIRCKAVLSNSPSTEVSEVADIDWDNIGFGLKPTDYMYVMKCNPDGDFSNGELQRFGNIELSPAAGVLNYGQGLFEGLKAYRKQDGNKILLFRPEENAIRMRNGAERMCMPAPTIEQFIEAVKTTVLANKRWVPPPGKGSLYVRPLLMGTGAVLGLAPAPEYTFLIYVSPVGNYFKEGVAPINLIVEDEFHRATPGGTGGVKTIGNYAAVLKAQSIAKAKGYSDVLYLDCVYKRFLEEVSSCNIFVVKDNVISTPEIKGTILPGITRKSIIDVARTQGFQVEERNVTVDELLEADEVFCTGTAVVVSPVGSITYKGKRVSYGEGSFGPVSEQLYTVLTSLQMGLSEDNMNWTMNLSEESEDLALVSVEVRQTNEIDEEENVERMEYEIQERIDGFIDELSIRHDAYPNSDSDGEGSANGKRKGKEKAKWSGEYDGYSSERRGDGTLYVGQTFYNSVDFKDAVLDHALKFGHNIKQYRYCKRKLGFDCAMRGGCKWRVYCSVFGNSNKWKIRIFNSKHTCVPNGECELLKVPVIARLFVDQIREEPDYMMPMKIEEIIRDRWKFNASRPQCQAARLSALRWIAKEYAEQFEHLRDYATEIISSNPGSTVDIEADPNEFGQEVFNRIFICFDSLRRSWKQNCRRLIGVDGCFLKARMKGQLLVAIGRDGDNKVYPIAWAVVQVENTENWVWFVRHLKYDLELNDGDGFIFVSDRQKGLIRALELELPKVEHRMCVRHIYANLKSRHGKKPNMKPLVWNLAWSYNEADYASALERIRCYDVKVYDDVMKSKPKTWCRAFQKVGSCCEDVENNSTESFNNSVGKAREKPLVPMLETIRRCAMVRITKRSVIANAYPGRCTPYVTHVMQKEHERAAECRVFRSTHGMFEVVIGGCAYRVCLERRTCTCRKWDLTGIPCEHAYGVIIDKRLQAEDYVDNYFHTTVWRSTYAESIVPLRGAHFWIQKGTPPIVEPPEPAQPGRKKNNKQDQKRKPTRNESPPKKAATGERRVMHCRICGEGGHNSRYHKKDGQSQVDDTQSQMTQVGDSQSQVFE